MYSFVQALDRPIAFQRVFVDVTGSITASLFLSQLVYWNRRTTDPDRWIYKTREEWQEETGMTRYEQETARNKLKNLGILTEELRGLPAKMYYRLEEEILNDILCQLGGGNPTNKEGENQPTSKVETTQQDGGKPTNIHITETTTEITPQTTSENPLPPKGERSVAGKTEILVEKYNQLWGTKLKATKGRVTKLGVRLKTFTFEEILTALENLSTSPWHRGMNERGWVADPDFLLRSDEQVDKWLNYNKPRTQAMGHFTKQVNSPTANFD